MNAASMYELPDCSLDCGDTPVNLTEASPGDPAGVRAHPNPAGLVGERQLLTNNRNNRISQNGCAEKHCSRLVVYQRNDTDLFHAGRGGTPALLDVEQDEACCQ